MHIDLLPEIMYLYSNKIYSKKNKLSYYSLIRNKSNIMKLIFYFFIAAGMLIACQKDTEGINDCGVENPIEELAWLHEMKNSISCICHSSIAQGTFKGQTVFFIIVPSFYCDAAGITIWDCNGDVVKEFLYIDDDPEMAQVEFVKVLYSCDDQEGLN